MPRLVSLWRNLVHRARVDRDLDEELRAAFELLVEEKIRSGMPPDDARRVARLELGSLESLKGEVRDARAGAGVETAFRDVRYALRSLRRNPGFAIVAVLTLAVGVGANTAIFSVLHAVVLRGLPYDRPDRLAVLWTVNDHDLSDGSSYLNVLDWKAESRAFSDMAAFRRPENTRGTISGGIEPERVHLGVVGPGFFRVLGAQPLLGRTLDSPDFEANHRAVVISHGFWRQRFAGDARILGTSLTIDGTAYEVVGVMAPDFELPTRDVQVWQPVSAQSNWNDVQRNERTRSADSFVVLGRLHPTATMESARAELETIASRLRTRYPRTNGGRGIRVVPLTDHVIGSRTEQSLWLLFGAVGCVLLIACVNVANLALARGGARRSEFALRAALGASRTRLVREALTENLVVAIVAAGGGLLVAWLGARALRTWASAALPRLDGVQLDMTVVLFALGASTACGLLAGWLPAWQLSAVNPEGVLREGAQRAIGNRGGRRLQHGLVIAEIALAVILLSGAGLLIRSAASVLSMVLSNALGLAAAGLGIGLGGAVILARTIASFLYQTSPLDPVIYTAVSVLLFGVTTAACLVPARRAARVDPVSALRYQ